MSVWTHDVFSLRQTKDKEMDKQNVFPNSVPGRKQGLTTPTAMTDDRQACGLR